MTNGAEVRPGEIGRMRRLGRCAIAVALAGILMLAAILSVVTKDGCCCAPSGKTCPMKKRGAGLLCAIARADACSISAPQSAEAPPDSRRPIVIRGILTDASVTMQTLHRPIAFAFVVGAILDRDTTPPTPPPKRA